jgi:hypothetical protein
LGVTDIIVAMPMPCTLRVLVVVMWYIDVVYFESSSPNLIMLRIDKGILMWLLSDVKRSVVIGYKKLKSKGIRHKHTPRTGYPRTSFSLF